MATKIEQSPSVQMSTSSALSSGGSKISMLGKKSGFVIPKNRLSGSLVPVLRGEGKVETGNISAEETNRVSRKTKWGADLTQDPVVKRGRALAYQGAIFSTRVDQITKHLKAEVHGGETEEGLQESKQTGGNAQNEHENSEQLELERREAIGEILRLNPSYKAPPDFKPLLKEAKVSVPQEAYPGYSFMNVLLGPESNTQKQLEEETGAKIRVYGTVKGTGEKGEINYSGKNKIDGGFEDIYVHISADTFEKVDAAVALIELLVTPVTGTSVVPTDLNVGIRNDVNLSDQCKGSAAPGLNSVPDVDQGVLHQTMGPLQSSLGQVSHQSYLTPWVTPGPLHTPNLPTGFISSSSGRVSSVPASHFSPSYSNPFNASPRMVAYPTTAAGNVPFPHNMSLVTLRLQQPTQILQGLINPVSSHQNSPIASAQTGRQLHEPRPLATAPLVAPRPPMPSINPSSMSDPAAQISTGSSSGWTGPVTSSTLRPPNTVQIGQSAMPLQRPHFPSLQSSIPFNSVGHHPPPRVGPMLTSPVNHHIAPAFSATEPQHNRGLMPGLTSPSGFSTAMLQAPIPAASAPTLFPPPRVDVSSLGHNPPRMQFSSPNSPLQPTLALTPGSILPSSHQARPPQRASLADFTFQPRSQLSVSQAQHPMPSGPTMASVNSLQPPSIRPAFNSSQGLPTYQQSGQAVTRAPLHSSNQFRLPGFTSFQNAPLPPPPPAPQMGQPGLLPAAYSVNLPGSSVQAGIVHPTRERGFIIQNPQSVNNLAYDPFSPTSVSPADPHGKQGRTKMRKPESDSEYEDLMTSVGVR